MGKRKKLELFYIYRKLRKLKDPDTLPSIKGKRVFSGEIRVYPNFKEYYKRLMESSFERILDLWRSTFDQRSEEPICCM